MGLNMSLDLDLLAVCFGMEDRGEWCNEDEWDRDRDRDRDGYGGTDCRCRGLWWNASLPQYQKVGLGTIRQL